MDSDELREILSTSKVDVWSLIDSAIAVAASDYGDELKDRRDAIVQKLYFPTSSGELCRSCRSPVEDKPPLPQQQKQVREMTKSPFTPESNHQTDDDAEEGALDPFGGLFDDEPDRIRHIREQLEIPDQDEESVVELLQNLVDMDITFKALEETDIGRVVSGFRKHASNEVRKLAKLLIRNWKETVDEWVKLNPPQQASASLAGVGDSPQPNVRNNSNGHYQVSDVSHVTHSPNPQNWGSGSEKNLAESAPKAKAAPARETPPSRPPQAAHPAKSSSVPPPSRQKESAIDMEKLNSARRRLQESYQEAQNAKRQRTIQVMDLHDLPKPKNTFFAKNKGGSRNHR